MTPEQVQFCRDWVQALRSGEYTQTTRWLRFTDADGVTDHCCLGVAEDIAGRLP